MLFDWNLLRRFFLWFASKRESTAAPHRGETAADGATSFGRSESLPNENLKPWNELRIKSRSPVNRASYLKLWNELVAVAQPVEGPYKCPSRMCYSDWLGFKSRPRHKVVGKMWVAPSVGEQENQHFGKVWTKNYKYESCSDLEKKAWQWTRAWNFGKVVSSVGLFRNSENLRSATFGFGHFS